MVTPLIAIEIAPARPASPSVGSLVTWLDYAGRVLSGRLIAITGDYVEIKVVGLNIQHPYSLGDVIGRKMSDVVDWE